MAGADATQPEVGDPPAAQARRLAARGFEEAPDPNGVVARDGQLVAANRALREALGRVERAAGPMAALLHPDSVGAWEGATDAADATGRSARAGLVLIRADGRALQVEATVGPALAGGPGGDVRTVTLREADPRDAATGLRDAFIAGLNHDVRTPLTSVRGSLRLLLGGAAGELPADVRRLVELAWRNEQRLSRHLGRMLDLDAIESGRVRFRFEAVDLGELAHAAARASAGSRPVHVQVGAGPLAVRGDRDGLARLLEELLGLAEAHARGPGAVELRVAPGEDAVHLTVRVPGGPLEPDAVARLLEPADAGVDPRGGAPALGAALARALAERHGGHLAARATPVGAVLELTLGAAAGDAVAADAPAPAHVLVCEDDPGTVSSLRSLLRGACYAVDVAPDVATARLLLARRGYDLLTLDLVLPDQDGATFLADLRRRAATRALPVVVVSACSGDDEPAPAAGARVGPTLRLDKKDVADHLVARVRAALGQEPAL